MIEDGEKGAILQRDEKTCAIAPHLPCGLVSPDVLRRLADTAERYSASALKITSSALCSTTADLISSALPRPT